MFYYKKPVPISHLVETDNLIQMADTEMKQMKILNSVLLEKLSESTDRIEKLEEENQVFKFECAKIKDELTKIRGENKNWLQKLINSNSDIFKLLKKIHSE